MLYGVVPGIEQYGHVRFRKWRVLELDASASDGPSIGPGFVRPQRPGIDAVLRRMAIVVPIRDEQVKFLEGVLAGIPAGVRVIVISNSERTPLDNFRAEREAISAHAHATGRRILHVHQRDADLAGALEKAGYKGLLDEEGLVRAGKGESMAAGVLLGLAHGCQSVGFVDSDNIVPGAVMEHVLNYAAGITMMGSDAVCVRAIWQAKPKVRTGIVFQREGRVSRITNRYFNRLMAAKTGFETDRVQTANAGEHALTATLAREMPLASGFSVETWELRWLLERYGGFLQPPSDAHPEGVDVVQIETRNPHFHAEKGTGHLAGMIAASLGVLYHSPLATDDFREEILGELARHGWEDKPPAPRVLPAPAEGDFETFAEWAKAHERERTVGLWDRSAGASA